jgi:hypothetical protein
MEVRPLAVDSWTAELDAFSRQHDGWLVSITTLAPDGRVAVAAHNRPLLGVSRVSRDSNDIAISVGDKKTHLTHDVRDAVALRIDLTNDRVERALVIDSKDGSTTSVEFRSPARVEEVDGLPGPRHL